jgi:Na+/H+ antiporter NhaD/arsenite permease-like protein
MDLGILSLIFLIVAIALGFFRKMNTGLVAIGLALVIGRIGGVAEKKIIAGFSGSLFIMLLGVTYLFSIAQVNGTLELFARKAVALAGKNTKLIPIVIYVLATFLAAIGPGTIPVMALMAVFTMALAAEMKVSPLLLAPMGLLGAMAGGISPIAPTGIIGITLAAEQGFTDIATPFFINSLISQTLFALLLYFVLGGYKIKADAPIKFRDLPKFDQQQVITLLGIAVMVIAVMFLKVNVGLMAFIVAGVLSFLKVAKEKEVVANVPWGTLLLVTGVGVLMNVVIELQGIKLLAAFLGSFMSANTASPIMALTGGVMSWFSSTSGVVMPTLIPTVGELITNVGGTINPVDLISAITNTSHAAGLSPVSTGGALALASYVSTTHVSEEEQHSLFIKMFAIAVGGVVFLSLLAGLGIYRIFI